MFNNVIQQKMVIKVLLNGPKLWLILSEVTSALILKNKSKIKHFAHIFMQTNWQHFFHHKCRKLIFINRLQGLCPFPNLCQLLLLITDNDFLILSILANPLRAGIIRTNARKTCSLAGQHICKHAICEC